MFVYVLVRAIRIRGKFLQATLTGRLPTTAPPPHSYHTVWAAINNTAVSVQTLTALFHRESILPPSAWVAGSHIKHTHLEKAEG